MKYFYSRPQMEAHLAQAFLHDYKRKDAVLTAILLVRPEDELVNKEILPHLEQWHWRSDRFTDFFCAGYGPADELPEGAIPTQVTIGGRRWGFSRGAYNEILEAVEARIDFSHRGDPFLLVLSAFNREGAIQLDFPGSLPINFREAMKVGAVQAPTHLAEAIFQAAKKINEGEANPIWVLSNELGRMVVQDGFLDTIVHLLPEALRPTARRAAIFSLRDRGVKSA